MTFLTSVVFPLFNSSCTSFSFNHLFSFPGLYFHVCSHLSFFYFFLSLSTISYHLVLILISSSISTFFLSFPFRSVSSSHLSLPPLYPPTLNLFFPHLLQPSSHSSAHVAPHTFRFLTLPSSYLSFTIHISPAPHTTNPLPVLHPSHNFYPIIIQSYPRPWTLRPNFPNLRSSSPPPIIFPSQQGQRKGRAMYIEIQFYRKWPRGTNWVVVFIPPASGNNR